uniref:Uncharacterized protein n=1 Tax=Melopsittacus undulatus TaxID=13146 RepID=A0A8V5GF96_MELUD
PTRIMAGKPGSAPASPLSSLLAPCNSQPYPVLYGQRSYSSASEALDACIEDFDWSQADPYGSCIHGSVPKEIRLEFFPSLYGRSQDPDSISLTTEELLAVPPDGSQPFPHPIPSNPRNPRGESLKTSPPRLGSAWNSHRNPGRKTLPNVSKGSPNPMERFSSTFPCGNEPGWLTNLSGSRMSSIPTSPCPMWLWNSNLFHDPAPNGINQSQASSSQIWKTGPPHPDNSHFSLPFSLHSRGDNGEGTPSDPSKSEPEGRGGKSQDSCGSMEWDGLELIDWGLQLMDLCPWNSMFST